jgi:hypothetical protein
MHTAKSYNKYLLIMTVYSTASGERNIISQARNASFTINGYTYKSLNDLLPGSNKVISMEKPAFTLYQIKSGSFILCRRELFPCFDSSDRMYENRFYRRYMICSSREEAIGKYNYILAHDESFNSINHNSLYLAPIIYADDERDMIEILVSE